MTGKWRYVRVKAPPEYPGATYASGWVLAHHLQWWRMSGKLVPKGHHIHHIDGDPTNNSPENLQLLDCRAHASEHAKNRPPVVVHLVCPICNVGFERLRRQTHLVKKGNKTTCCSRSCSATASHRGVV